MYFFSYNHVAELVMAHVSLIWEVLIRLLRQLASVFVWICMKCDLGRWPKQFVPAQPDLSMERGEVRTHGLRGTISRSGGTRQQSTKSQAPPSGLSYKRTQMCVRQPSWSSPKERLHSLKFARTLPCLYSIPLPISSRYQINKSAPTMYLTYCKWHFALILIIGYSTGEQKEEEEKEKKLLKVICRKLKLKWTRRKVQCLHVL